MKNIKSVTVSIVRGCLIAIAIVLCLTFISLIGKPYTKNEDLLMLVAFILITIFTYIKIRI